MLSRLLDIKAEMACPLELRRQPSSFLLTGVAEKSKKNNKTNIRDLVVRNHQPPSLMCTDLSLMDDGVQRASSRAHLLVGGTSRTGDDCSRGLSLYHPSSFFSVHHLPPPSLNFPLRSTNTYLFKDILSRTNLSGSLLVGE